MTKEHKNSFTVAVVGALGMVGREMIRTLERRQFPVKELIPLDIEENAGKTIDFRGSPVAVRSTTPESFSEVDIALFSAGADASLQFAPEAADRGAIVIDNSSAWRMNPECPLVVPEVNPQDLDAHHGIIANPNCSTIQMVAALQPIHEAAQISRIVVSTYQAVSGSGIKAFNGLRSESGTYLQSGKTESLAYDRQIAFNCIPQIDVFQNDGYTKEEKKMIFETGKILDPGIRVTATCVRVPVFYGHSESINIETIKPLSPEQARDILGNSPGIMVIDEPENSQYPTPVMSNNEDKTMVGRIRRDTTVPNGLNIWVVSNNIRKGAALNAVQIAETLIIRDLV